MEAVTSRKDTFVTAFDEKKLRQLNAHPTIHMLKRRWIPYLPDPKMAEYALGSKYSILDDQRVRPPTPL